MTAGPAHVVPPLRKHVVVPVAPETAFAAFTGDIARWWPLATHSVGGATSTVGFTDDELVEMTHDGRRCVWGRILAWQPPYHLAVTWHPGQDAPEPATTVEVSFESHADGCLVTLVHNGWENLPVERRAVADYDEGWTYVLGRYLDLVSTP